jgi:hypothetical protein
VVADFGELLWRICCGDDLTRIAKSNLLSLSMCVHCCPHPLEGTTILLHSRCLPQPGLGAATVYCYCIFTWATWYADNRFPGQRKNILIKVLASNKVFILLFRMICSSLPKKSILFSYTKLLIVVLCSH